MFSCYSKVMGESVQVNYMLRGKDVFILDILQHNRPLDIAFNIEWVLRDVLADCNKRGMVN